MTLLLKIISNKCVPFTIYSKSLTFETGKTKQQEYSKKSAGFVTIWEGRQESARIGEDHRGMVRISKDWQESAWIGKDWGGSAGIGED